MNRKTIIHILNAVNAVVFLFFPLRALYMGEYAVAAVCAGLEAAFLGTYFYGKWVGYNNGINEGRCEGLSAGMSAGIRMVTDPNVPEELREAIIQTKDFEVKFQSQEKSE